MQCVWFGRAICLRLPPPVASSAADGTTALHLAAGAGHASVVSLLLQKGAWADAEDSHDETPLHAAAKRGHVACLDALLQHGVKPERVNKLGLTAAGEALLHGHVAAAEKLVEWGAALQERPRGYSLLHLAAGLGRAEAVDWLLGRAAKGAANGEAEADLLEFPLPLQLPGKCCFMITHCH